MDVFYNEWDKTAAQWMRNLIAAGQLPKGQVSQDDIRTLTGQSIPFGTKQAHFFAGIGGWALALQLAGWPDDREVWTASCPCQPFSCAGKQQGFSDERDLWPDTFRIIAERKPETVFGEQVASKDGLLWLDRVYADLEGAGYAVAAFDLCAAGISAPHIRQRLYWMAHCLPQRSDGGDKSGEVDRAEDGAAGPGQGATEERATDSGFGAGHNAGGGRIADGERGGMVHPVQQGLEGQPGHGDGRNEPGRFDTEANGPATEASGGVRLSDDKSIRYPSQRLCRKGILEGLDGHISGDDGISHGENNGLGGIETPPGENGNERPEYCSAGDDSRLPDTERVGLAGQLWGGARCEFENGRPTNDAWRQAVVGRWQDGTARRFEPGILPLAHGVPGRVGQIRGYGNAIVPPLAAEFVMAAMEVLGIKP